MCGGSEESSGTEEEHRPSSESDYIRATFNPGARFDRCQGMVKFESQLCSAFGPMASDR